ncbi:MAG: hypothetical protein AB7P04_10295 [Bacteriovoracia bacterium]
MKKRLFSFAVLAAMATTAMATAQAKEEGMFEGNPYAPALRHVVDEDYPAALSVLDQIQQASPDIAGADLLRGMILARMGKEQAEPALEALRNVPSKQVTPVVIAARARQGRELERMQPDPVLRQEITSDYLSLTKQSEAPSRDLLTSSVEWANRVSEPTLRQSACARAAKLRYVISGCGR